MDMPRWPLAIIMGSLLLAGPAMADVDVYIEYDKDKDIYVYENIYIDKDVDIDVKVVSLPERAAEAEALINQDNKFNEACENCAEKRDIIRDSGSRNNGVVDVNQAAGNMNNQGNAVSIAVDDRQVPPDAPDESPKPGDSYAQAQSAVEQRNHGNLDDATNLIEKSARIANSFNANAGVVHVNEATGNMANQANSLAMAVGFGEGGVSIAEADLGQYNAFNDVFESGENHESEVAHDGFVNKHVTITGSVNRNSGVVGVNQTAGNMANQANVVAFAVVIGQNPDPITTAP
jgi:hypothetical protein